MALLSKAGNIRIGKGRAPLYALATATESAPAADDYTSYIQLSDTSRELLTLLRRPSAARKPAAYEREWLEAYSRLFLQPFIELCFCNAKTNNGARMKRA